MIPSKLVQLIPETVYGLAVENRIETFTPPQEEALSKGLFQKNMVVSSPTASGKTLIAEMSFLKTTLEESKKAVYIVPLKALASEKYSEFKEKYGEKIRVMVSTGDADSPDEWLVKADLIITTSEKMDSLIRHSATWLSKLGLVVVDELHLIGDASRGATLEVVITRLKNIPDLRILCLSATIKNCKELSEWLGAELVESDYRPVVLHEGVLVHNRITFRENVRNLKADYGEASYNLVKNAYEQGKQSIVFVSSRRRAESLASKLEMVNDDSLKKLSEKVLKSLPRPTTQCRKLSECLGKGVAFHHAGLVQKQKTLIEQAFRNGELPVIFATPTLCLDENTKVWTGMDEIPIKRVRKNNLFVLKGDFLEKCKPQIVSKLDSPKQMIRITTRSGKKITVTKNHKMFVKKNGEKNLIYASKCKVNDRIAMIGRLPLKTSKINKLSDFVLNNKLPFDDELREQDFYFIGLMLGDGYSGAEIVRKIKYKGTPMFVNKNLLLLDGVKSFCANRNIRFRESISKHGVPRIILTKSKWFREFLVRCGVDIGHKKRISSCLKEANTDLLSCILRGLFDADGYVEIKPKRIGFSSVSEKLVYDVQKCLLRFGIVSNIRIRKPNRVRIHNKTYQTRESSELLITHMLAIKKFYDFIGFNSLKKRNALETILSPSPSMIHKVECKKCGYSINPNLFSGRTERQKIWGAQKKRIIELLGEKKRLTSKKLINLLHFVPRKREARLNQHYALITKMKSGDYDWSWQLNELGVWVYKNILAKNGDLANFFNESNKCPICNSEIFKEIKKNWRSNDFEGDIFWDIIRDVRYIKPSSGTVYDVAFRNTDEHDHLFVANGFVIHNSMGVDLPAFQVVIRDLKRYSQGYNDWISVIEYKQLAGRAGRPRYSDYGEAISVASSEEGVREIFEKFIDADLEEVYSQLSAEPNLRTHLLSLIAQGVVRNETDILIFFGKTFYAKQYGDLSELNNKIRRTLAQLEEWDFIKYEGEKITPTKYGLRTSELYLDPRSAYALISAVRNSGNPSEIGLIHACSMTGEARPLLNLNRDDYVELAEDFMHDRESLMVEEPEPNSYEAHNYLRAYKTARMIECWIDEKSEQEILDDFKVSPGDIRSKTVVLDWLLYSMKELAHLLEAKQLVTPINNLRIRVKHGVKTELLPLIKYKGIGRVRARALFVSGIRTSRGLRDANMEILKRLVGERTALKLKEQVEKRTCRPNTLNNYQREE